MTTFELYRKSTIGMCLAHTLDEMVENYVITPELAIQVLIQFDKSMVEALESHVSNKVSIKLLERLHKPEYAEPSLMALGDIYTPTDSATMFGLLSCMMHYSKVRNVRKMSAKLK